MIGTIEKKFCTTSDGTKFSNDKFISIKCVMVADMPLKIAITNVCKVAHDDIWILYDGLDIADIIHALDWQRIVWIGKDSMFHICLLVSNLIRQIY